MPLQVPYPFVTQEGAGNAIQVHDGTGLTSSGCYIPTPSLSGFTILTQVMTPTSSAGNQIITPEDYTTKNLGSYTTVTISGTVPATGLAYVTIHLDYGLKKTYDWKPAGTSTVNPVSGVSILDMWKPPYAAGALTIHGYLFLSIGTSTLDHPAASLPFAALDAGAVVVEINPERTPLSHLTEERFEGPAGTVLPRILEAAGSPGWESA